MGVIQNQINSALGTVAQVAGMGAIASNQAKGTEAIKGLAPQIEAQSADITGAMGKMADRYDAAMASMEKRISELQRIDAKKKTGWRKVPIYGGPDPEIKSRAETLAEEWMKTHG